MEDGINRVKMLVEYCTTMEMWADVLTKPLQGKQYRITISNLMNMTDIYVDPDDNEPEKISKSAGVYEKDKRVEFNQYIYEIHYQDHRSANQES